MTLAYPVIIEPLAAEDGGGYLARVPDLPGCMSDGETPQEALANVIDAIEGWLAAAADWQVPVTEPMRSRRVG